MRYLIVSLLFFACTATDPATVSSPTTDSPGGPRYSLGQWSFHRALFDGEMDNFDFVATAGEMDFDGVELVNQFFADRATDAAFLDSLRAAADDAGVALTMLLIDGAGNLGDPDAAARDSAVARHLEWVAAAERLGIRDLRINAHGAGTYEAVLDAATDGVGKLARAARESGVRILIENHGGWSSNGTWLSTLLQRLEPEAVGAVADFDNWCYQRDNGQLWGGKCTARYDRYKGMQELMPYAGGVSVKAFNFTADGAETVMDFRTLFDAIRASGYDGYLGIEYEGDSLPAREGVEKTRALAERSWPRNTVVTPTARERIDSTLRGFVSAGDIAGVSALVFEKGDEAYFGAFGQSDREADIPMQRNTIVQIYSMTKPITGVALMQLYEQDKFELDDPLADHLPEFRDVRVYVSGGGSAGTMQTRATSRPILVRDITRHTAGFYTGGDPDGLQQAFVAADLRSYENTLTTMGEKLGQLPLRSDPGTEWHYGPSVDVQALLVERLSGQAFDAYLREHIFTPLGMNDTRYVVPEADRDRFSAAYRRDADGTLTQLPSAEAHEFNLRQWPLTPGGFGLTSTLDDYMTFARMLLNGGSLDGVRILQPETVRLMRTNQLSDEVTERLWLPSKGQVGFGIDFAVRQRPPATAAENPGKVGEFFWDGAASTLFWVDPANELAAVLFVQLFPFDQIGLHHDFRRAIYGPFVPLPEAAR